MRTERKAHVQVKILQPKGSVADNGFLHYDLRVLAVGGVSYFHPRHNYLFSDCWSIVVSWQYLSK